MSDARPIDAGVPQRFCLASQLFAIYINDLPADPKTRTALFADNTIIYAVGNTNNAVAKDFKNIWTN